MKRRSIEAKQTRRHHRALVCFSGTVGLILWLTLVGFPGPPGVSLDQSWCETLVHAAANRWQFGKEIVFTYGPFGYLTSPSHLGIDGATSRIIWEIVGKLILGSGLAYAIRKKPILIQLSFVCATIWSNWILGGSYYLVVIGVAVIEVLLNRDELFFVRLLYVFGLAFLAEIKFTNLVLAAFGIAIAIVYFGCQGKRRTAVGLAATFPLALLFWWAIAGQNLENFAPYLNTSWKVASGYSASMGLDEGNGIFFAGVTIMVGWMAFVLQLVMRKRDRAHGFAVAAFVAFNAFIWWKYGFTRADSHTNSLFLATVLLSIILPWSLMPEVRFHWLWGLGLIALLAFRYNEPAFFPGSFRASLIRLRSNAADLTHFASLPERWRSELAVEARTHYLPITNESVRSESIDLVSCEQGLLLLNGLNFTPRPVFQGYSAYLPALARLNLDFYRSEGAPQFILWRQETIDGRFPTIDDAQLYPEIRRSYSVKAHEEGFLLLRRNEVVPRKALDRVLIVKGRLKFRDLLSVPPSHGRTIWIRAGFKLSRLGMARALIYKPPQLFMSITDSQGASSSWRVLPDVAADGFVLSPILATTSDFESFCSGSATKTAATICFSPAPNQDYLWEKAFTVGFYSLESKPEAGSN